MAVLTMPLVTNPVNENNMAFGLPIRIYIGLYQAAGADSPLFHFVGGTDDGLTITEGPEWGEIDGGAQVNGRLAKYLIAERWSATIALREHNEPGMVGFLMNGAITITNAGVPVVSVIETTSNVTGNQGDDPREIALGGIVSSCPEYVQTVIEIPSAVSGACPGDFQGSYYQLWRTHWMSESRPINLKEPAAREVTIDGMADPTVTPDVDGTPTFALGSFGRIHYVFS